MLLSLYIQEKGVLVDDTVAHEYETHLRIDIEGWYENLLCAQNDNHCT